MIGVVTEQQTLLPTFKKKTGPKPKYASVTERTRVINQRYRDKLRAKGLNRVEVPMPSELANKLTVAAKNKAQTPGELTVEILQKLFDGELITLESIFRGKVTHSEAS